MAQSTVPRGVVMFDNLDRLGFRFRKWCYKVKKLVVPSIAVLALIFSISSFSMLHRLINYDSANDVAIVNQDTPVDIMRSMYTIVAKGPIIEERRMKTDAWGFVNLGTADAVSEHRLLTAAHVTQVLTDYGMTDFMLYRFDLQGELTNRIPFKVVKEDPDVDLALIEVEEVLPCYLKFEDPEVFDALRPGMQVYGLGAGSSGGGSEDGITNPYCFISGKLRKTNADYVIRNGWELKALDDMYIIDCVVLPGCSGGAILNPRTNRLIGVTSFGSNYLTGFVPITTVRDFLTRNHLTL